MEKANALLQAEKDREQQLKKTIEDQKIANQQRIESLKNLLF